MKNFVLPVGLVGGALLCGVAQAQQTPAAATATRPANVLNTLVTSPASATPGESLLALAKAANINVLADVSDAESPAPEKATETKPRTLYAALKELSAAQKWGWRRVSDQTFLLWKQSDTVALARQIMATEAVANAADVAKPVAATPGDAEPLNVALTRYFATPAARNDPNNPADWREVPLAELPPALRERIIASVSGAGRGGLQFAASGAVLGDAFWQDAVLKIRELAEPAPRPRAGEPQTAPVLIKYVFVAGRFERDGKPATTMLSLGRWKAE